MKTSDSTHASLQIIGHRGARGLAPENTLASIQKALDYGVDEVEIDVRVTKDNIPILHHDLYLRDPAGNRLNIRTHTYDDLKKHKADLATLHEAIWHVNKAKPILIEVKPDERTKPIIKVLKYCVNDGFQASDFLLGSKKQSTLMKLHRALPDVPTVVIEPWLSIRAVYRAQQLKTRRLSMNHLFLWYGFIRAMHRRGYKLYTYTLNDVDKATRWQRFGLAGVITDLPDTYKD